MLKNILLIAVLFIASCASKEEKKVEPVSGLAKVDSLVAAKQFSAALSLMTLEGQREDRVTADVHARYKEIIVKVKEDAATNPEAPLVDAYLAYAIWLEYFGLDMKANNMKEIMPAALAHYRKVLELDPDNEKAVSEIQQIEGIYRSMNREVPQGVAE